MKVILSSPPAKGTSGKGRAEGMDCWKTRHVFLCVQINNGLGLWHRGQTELLCWKTSPNGTGKPSHCPDTALDSELQLSTKGNKNKSCGAQHQTRTVHFQERAVVLTPALQPGEGLQPTDIPLNSCLRQGQGSTWGWQYCQP